MQVFKTNKKIFWISELKSWLGTVAFTALLYFGIHLFSSVTNSSIIIGVIIVLFLKLADGLIQYHVVEIRIDDQKNQLTFVLTSIMSGEKIKSYELRQATSELINNTGLTKYLSSPFILKIMLNPKDSFRISNRYGFSFETLTSVDRILKLMIA